ncbi:zinc-binding alcohol dehydrogenase family protein [Shimia gijangensis]|uniref:Zinc-type alcohol dehydrogenase-like protein n=1 Tax=Shimia gijangensis TaxID=1470563 RepID=A0A1M6QWI4_9RHOB|nr:zinc-binding alcohol dehydrogenase family protein [Shimia gijangensis]SHK24555.1 zinc-binding alcohol dehydrogenase family protein [Shimia gijangensis]
MKTIGFIKSLKIEEADSLFEVDQPMPELKQQDVLVRIEAISINPADAKIRIRSAAEQPHDEPKILGYDAVGVIEKLGPDVAGFKEGDRVWYAGDVNRPGSYAEYQAVDHRIIAKAPVGVAPTSSASMPLVSLTAWEILFDRLQVPLDDSSSSLLIIGGAGGVGSVTTQLARALTQLQVVATASRPESSDWCRKMGAHEVVDHRDLVQNFRATDREFAEFIVQYADLAQHWDAMCELVAPQGRIGTIVETSEKIDISALQGKSAALMWELMFTRTLFGTADIANQGHILDRVARLVEDGTIQTTQTRVLTGLSAETLKTAHEIIESGTMIGKLVVDFTK